MAGGTALRMRTHAHARTANGVGTTRRRLCRAPALVLVASCTVSGGGGQATRTISKPPAQPSVATVGPTRGINGFAGWIAAADARCRTGALLYPSLPLGVRSDVDTVSYGINALASSLLELPAPAAERDRARAEAVLEPVRAAAQQWQALAGSSRPAPAARVDAATAAATALNGLALAGARSCGRLAPAAR